MWETIALKSALRTLGVMIALGAAQAYSSGFGEDFVLRPSLGPFTVDSAPPSSSQANATADGVFEAQRDGGEEAPTHAGDSEQNAGDAEPSLGISLEGINEIDEDGLTPPLMRAAQDGDEERIRRLIGLGVDVNQRAGLLGQTALHLAAGAGQEKIVRLLVNELGADVNQRDNADRSLLDHAAKGYKEVARLLAQEFEAQGNQRDRIGGTALHWAAMGGHEGTVRLLVQEFHADFNQFDNNGETPLHWAIAQGHEGMIHILLEELRVNINQPTSEGRLPIGIAAFRGHLVLVRYLHRRGAQLTQVDGGNRTPLDYAVLGGHLEIIDWIIATLIRVEFINQLRSGNRADWMRQILTRYGQVFWDQLLGIERLEFLNQILARRIPEGLSEALN